MGFYAHRDRADAEETRGHIMHSAQDLNDRENFTADGFLTLADTVDGTQDWQALDEGEDDAEPVEGEPEKKKIDLFSSDPEALSLWEAAAGLYSTDGDDGELAWQADALCAQTDPEAFFPEKGGSTRDAKRVCGECPVREACLEYAMDNDERFGIWGGLSERERRRLRKQAV